MALNPAHALPLRTLWLASIAVLLAAALWLFWRDGAPIWTGSGDAALPPSLKVDGAVTSTVQDGAVIQIRVPLTLRGSDAIHLVQDGRIHAVTYMAETASAAVPATYDVEWLDGNGDEFLDADEHVVMTVDLPAGSPVTVENPAKLVIKPIDSMPLTIEGVLP
jgi:hypothetical protein